MVVVERKNWTREIKYRLVFKEHRVIYSCERVETDFYLYRHTAKRGSPDMVGEYTRLKYAKAAALLDLERWLNDEHHEDD